MRFKNFAGSSYTLSNQQYELQRTVNLYPEWNEMLITGKNGDLKHMPYTPGLTVAAADLSGSTQVVTIGASVNSTGPWYPTIGGDGSGYYDGSNNGGPACGSITGPGTLNGVVVNAIAFSHSTPTGTVGVVLTGALPQSFFTSFSFTDALSGVETFLSSAATHSTTTFPGFTIWTWPAIHNYPFPLSSVPVTFTINPPLPGVSRGKWTMTNGITISIFGNTVYQVTGAAPPFTYTAVGTLLTSSGTIPQLAFADNGSLFGMSDGTYGYHATISSGNVVGFAQITDSVFVSYGPTRCCQYYDGFFLFNQSGTNNFFWSNRNAFTFGGPTPTAGNDSKTGGTDPIVFICVINRYLWLVGTQTSEIWYDSPSGNFIFQRISGPFIEFGCLDANTAQKTENGLFWLASSLRGNVQVVLTEGENVVPISTQPVSLTLAKYPQTGWSSWSYGDRQHSFYMLNPPGGSSAASSWGYDFVASNFAGQQQWHERTYTNPVTGQESRHLADNHCVRNGYHLVGDYASANDYYLDYNNYTDNGAPITRRRRSPFFSNDMLLFYTDLFQLDVQGGVGSVWDSVNSVYRDPVVNLYHTDDGYNWVFDGTESLGGTGEYIQRCQFWQLGLCESGYRAFEVVITDPIPVDIVGASLKITMGEPY